MANNLSKTQIDKLGDRVRKGDITEADLRLLDEYRRSFSDAYEFVIEEIRSRLELEPTGRPAKSTSSIREKLLRESIRLSQVQDIAGCRQVVQSVAAQESALESLRSLFTNLTVVDRRRRPSHGYRAVHLIVKHSGKLVEIQLRTTLQHMWAEFSEKLSDVFDPAIKYGGGDAATAQLLLDLSALLARAEKEETALMSMEQQVSELLSRGTRSEVRRKKLIDVEREIRELKKEQIQISEDALAMLHTLIDSLPKKKRRT